MFFINSINCCCVGLDIFTISDFLRTSLIFENFIKDAERYSKALSAWWGLDEQILISDLNNLHEPNHLVKASKEELEKIDNHFSSKRIKQWSSFFSRNILSKV